MLPRLTAQVSNIALTRGAKADRLSMMVGKNPRAAALPPSLTRHVAASLPNAHGSQDFGSRVILGIYCAAEALPEF